jgi:hypothetical protein
LGWYLAVPKHRPGWLRADRLLGEHGLPEDTAANREEFERRLEVRRREEVDEESFQPLRRGWCLGSAEFRGRMLELLEQGLGEPPRGEQRLESAEAKAGRIMKEELARRGWTPEGLARRRKSDPEKLTIAARLRKETTLSLKRVAQLAWLGTSKGANTNLHKWMQHTEQQKVESGTTKGRKQC